MVSNLGIKGRTFRIIRDMYAKVKSCVKSANTMSDFFQYAVGLRRGEVLSPLLFSLFVDDLELYLQDRTTCGLSMEEINITVLLFADDMVIVGNSPEALPNSLNFLLKYCSDWGLAVIYNDEHIEVVNNFNYCHLHASSHTCNFISHKLHPLTAVNSILGLFIL